jgi:hypothetical protein
MAELTDEQRKAIADMIADKNFGGAWYWADAFRGVKSTYTDFLREFIWEAK